MNTSTPSAVGGRLSEALDHINRNGSLLWMRSVSNLEARALFEEMIGDGLIARNEWSGNWTLTAKGRAIALAGGE